MNKPLATIMRALFTGGAFGHYHSSVHPLPDPILHDPIRIVNLDATSWWWEPEETLGADDLCIMHSRVQEAWNSMRMDLVLLRQGNMSTEQGLLVCHLGAGCQDRQLPSHVGGGNDDTLCPNCVAPILREVCW